jgi:hypothetical protein
MGQLAVDVQSELILTPHQEGIKPNTYLSYDNVSEVDTGEC